MEKKRKTTPRSKKQSIKKSGSRMTKRCGLCGETVNLTKTDCCGQWICDDEDQYLMFSYARNSCSRNHWRYTLCGYHYNERHNGDWRECDECKKDFEPEMY